MHAERRQRSERCRVTLRVRERIFPLAGGDDNVGGFQLIARFTTNDGDGPRSGRTEKIHSSDRIVSRSSVTDDDPHIRRVDHKRIMHKLEGMFDQRDRSPTAHVPQKVRADERSMIRRTDSRQQQTPARSCGLCRALDLCPRILEQLCDPIRLLLDSLV